jgi:hypothetical protein
MTHDDCRAALALHALDALPIADVEALTSHLVRCASCAGDLADLRETTATLALLARPLPPPPDHVDRVLAAIDTAAERPSPVLRTVRARPRAHPPASLTVVLRRLAAACVVAALAFSNVVLVRRLDRAQREMAHMRAIGAFVSSPDVTVVPLTGRHAHAKLAFDQTTGQFVFLSADLPPPPLHRRYRLWVIDDTIEPAAVVLAASAGGTLANRPHADALFLFAVSIEPDDAGDEPTGPMVLLSAALRSRAARSPSDPRVETP